MLRQESHIEQQSGVAKQPIVFVGGVHCVGKTTISKAMAALLPASHVTAGTLIRETAGAADIVNVNDRSKAVPNVDANQALLLRGLQLYQARVGPLACPLLLDGHFSLLDGTGKVVAIPFDVFRLIAPVAVILVEAPPGTVLERLLGRDLEAPTLKTISELAERESAHAEEVSRALAIPLWRVSADIPAGQAALAPVQHLRSFFGGGLEHE